MNLSHKIILMVVSSFIALVFIVAMTSDILLLNSFTVLEHKLLQAGHNDDIVKHILEQRPVYEQGKMALWYVVATLTLCSALLCGAVLLFLRNVLVRRLLLLTERVKEISGSGNVHERLDVNGDDELAELAHSINAMLDSLAKSEKQLKEGEQRYRTLFERAPDAILVIGLDGDETGKIVAANGTAALQHGYTVDEICKMKIFDLNTPETNQLAPTMIEQISNGAWITQQAWHLKKDGSQFPIEIHAGMINMGGKRYILGFDRDITLRMLAEQSNQMHLEQITGLNQELSAQASNLVLANAELESFNYSVSHDIKGPLTRISGYCQLLLEDKRFDEEAHGYLVRIYEASCWIDELIDAMLDLSRLSRLEFVMQSVDLSNLVRQALEELYLAEPARSISLCIKPEQIVTGDPNLLKIAVTNLVNNAWKYSAHKSHTVIEFGSYLENGTTVYFIRDEGAGFEMTQSHKLFRLFNRLHDSKEFTGNGIGLATVQRVIAKHGGKIWAQATQGVGATFFFTLQPAFENSTTDVSSII